MIFVDSNVPMYLVGAPHTHKIDAQRALEQCIAEGRRLVTDAEVLQEILHRYAAKRLSARDALHIAIMHRHGVKTVLSFDAGYDGVPGIRRLPSVS